ncbi:MAG TPA: glycosyltransferase family 4 protein [Conexibacter sp.]|jgi:glycosyltransferase involved in cell wall biosynthesis|nr:glycosyltransferase family 4 protein [Conexibacter sp.]
MKVAYVCNRYPAISNTFILREVRALRRRGVDVHTFTVRRPGREHILSQADREEDASTYGILPLAPWSMLRAHLSGLLRQPHRYLATLALAWRLSRPGLRGRLWQLFYFAESVLIWHECRRRGIRHIHAHFTHVASDDALLASHLGRWTWSFTTHGGLELFDISRTRLAEKARRADAVVCVSDFGRSQVMAHVEEDHWDKIHVVRCGIEPAAFSRDGEISRNGDGARIEVLCVARLVQLKGHAVLLNALAMLHAAGVPVHATLLGDGPSRRALERLAEQLELGELVTFAGAVGQDEIASWYAAADVFCLPSFAEGLPVVLMEAMAMGLPVVASRITGVPELVEHDRSGLLVTPGRADELAAALARLAAEPELRERLGRRARETVLERYDVDRCSELLHGVLERTVARA